MLGNRQSLMTGVPLCIMPSVSDLCSILKRYEYRYKGCELVVCLSAFITVCIYKVNHQNKLKTTLSDRVQH